MLIGYAGAEKRSRYVQTVPAKRSGNYRGGLPGRKWAVFTPDEDATIVQLYTEGKTYGVIAEKVGRSRTTVFKRCRHLRLPERTRSWRRQEGT